MLKLDMNLLWTVVNVLIMYVLLRKFLFKPVQDVIAKRQQMVDAQLADAQIADLTRTVCAKVLERNLTQQDDARLLDDLLQKAGDSDGKRS